MSTLELVAPGNADAGDATPNALREALHDRRFFWTVEFIPSVDKVLRDELHKLGGVAKVLRGDNRLAAFSVTDRVVSDRDPDPVAAAAAARVPHADLRCLRQSQERGARPSL